MRFFKWLFKDIGMWEVFDMFGFSAWYVFFVFGIAYAVKTEILHKDMFYMATEKELEILIYGALVVLAICCIGQLYIAIKRKKNKCQNTN